jgi:acyl-coenzyme A thioesterase PaaI-like protein
MNAVTPTAQLSGLEQLRAAFDPDRPERAPGIGKTMGFTVIEIEEGRVVFGGTPDESVYNPIGTVHGGYSATLLDSAVGCAVHSVLDRKSVV